MTHLMQSRLATRQSVLNTVSSEKLECMLLLVNVMSSAYLPERYQVHNYTRSRARRRVRHIDWAKDFRLIQLQSLEGSLLVHAAVCGDLRPFYHQAADLRSATDLFGVLLLLGTRNPSDRQGIGTIVRTPPDHYQVELLIRTNRT